LNFSPSQILKHKNGESIMTGKTHYTVGTACALVVAAPNTVTELGICLALSALGSTICDIDSAKSPTHRRAVKIFNLIALAGVLLFLGVRFFSLSTGGFSLGDLMPYWGIIGFLVVCFIGAHMPHRSFMHSIFVLALLSLCVADVNNYAALCFSAAMCSHILLDLMNLRRVKLFYPCKWGFCFGFCPHDGFVNHCLFLGGGLVALAGVGLALLTACGVHLG
jgi:inner membrane protein